MSLRVTGYTPDGRRIVADDGPSRARVSGYGGSALGHAITLVLTEAQRKAAERLRDEKRSYRLASDWAGDVSSRLRLLRRSTPGSRRRPRQRRAGRTARGADEDRGNP